MLGAATAAILLALGASAQAEPFAYVANSDGDSVSQYDVGAGGLLAPLSPPAVAAGDRPTSVAVSPDGQSVYVTNARDSTVSQYSVGAGGALSPKSPATVAAGSNDYLGGPYDLAVTPDGQSVYVADTGYVRGGGGLLQYSVGAGGALSSSALAPYWGDPFGVAVSPDGQSVYATHFDGGYVSQYDVGAGGELSFKHPNVVAAGVGALEVAVSPDGQSVYVADYEDGNVSQYDVGAGGKLSPKSPATVAAGSYTNGVAVGPDAKSVYVTNENTGTVYQYDVGAGGELSPKSPATVAAGAGSFGVAVDQDGQSVYVTDAGTGAVYQYDVGAGGKLSPKSPATVAAGAGAFGVAVSPPLNHPQTTITGGPTATNDPTPTFTFSASEPGSTFDCKLDFGAYSACSSPKTTAHLTDGRHTFYVRAKDPGGTVDPTPGLRTFTVRTASVSVSGSTLTVTAATGAKDNLAITRPPPNFKLRVTDLPSGPHTGSGLHAGAGCTRSGDSTAHCNASGITLVRVLAADQGDQVTNSTAIRSALNGGPANDTLIGGSAKDTLTGGPGADVMNGMNGDDQLMAHDGASDTLINCDGGTKPGTADKADLDLLPKDPNTIVKGCETKTRH